MSEQAAQPTEIEVIREEKEPTSLAVVRFDASVESIRALGEKVKGLRIDDADPDSFKAFKEQYREVMKTRTGIDKLRKELKAPAVEYGKRVDRAAKRLLELIKPIEAPLLEERKRHEAVLGERRQKVEARIAQIRSMGEAGYTSASAIGEAARNLDEHEIVAELYGGMMAEAEAAKSEVLTKLDAAYHAAVEKEKKDAQLRKEREENEKLKRELAEMKAKQAAKQAAEEAERKAKEEAERKAKEEAEVEEKRAAAAAEAPTQPLSPSENSDPAPKSDPAAAPPAEPEVVLAPGDPGLATEEVIAAAQVIGDWMKRHGHTRGAMDLGPLSVTLRGCDEEDE